MAIPGVFTFLQSPPPIGVSGQFSTSVYQFTMHSSRPGDIQTWAREDGGASRAARLEALRDSLPGGGTRPDVQNITFLQAY